MNDQLLELLRCPLDHSELHVAPAEMVQRLNRAIGARTLFDRTGRVVERTLDGGLVRAAGDLLYPFVDEIPIMLGDEAIPLDQVDAASTQEK